MALETLKDVEEIGGFEVRHLGEGQVMSEDENPFIVVNHETNQLGLKIQSDPISVVGVNGCQVDTLIEAAKLIVEGLNNKFPCRENACAITKLDETLMWLNKRKQDREKRGVEGKSEK